jgi:hypothetical protein
LQKTIILDCKNLDFVKNRQILLLSLLKLFLVVIRFTFPNLKNHTAGCVLLVVLGWPIGHIRQAAGLSLRPV